MRPPNRDVRVPDEIVEAFRAVAPGVEAFARDHDLLIERYRRGKSAWELRFARRRGGEAALTISYREKTGHVLDVTAVWWLDDFERRTRRVRTEKIGAYYRREDPDGLRRFLAEGLRRIEAWTLDDLGPAYGPFRDWTKQYTDERNRLPLR